MPYMTAWDIPVMTTLFLVGPNIEIAPSTKATYSGDTYQDSMFGTSRHGIISTSQTAAISPCFWPVRCADVDGAKD